jgi:SAM-dependent methyltransferase
MESEKRSERYGEVLYRHAGEEEQRLRALAGMLDPGTFRRLAALEPRPEWRCLEIGAGTGTVARWLARRCPDGRVVATDLDVSYLKGASERNLEAMVHDVTVDEFPEGSFNLIHARWVFMHLRERDAVLQRVVRWLVPGGWLLLEEGTDFAIASSPHAAYRKFMTVAAAMVRERLGMDMTWSRAFPAQLVRAGLTEVGCDGDWPGLRGGDAMPQFHRLSAASVADPLVKSGALTAQECAEAIAAFDDPGFFDLGVTTMAAWGRRPIG